MALTDAERADVLRRALQDDHVQAIERLRAAAHTWLRWPLSHARLNAVLDAYLNVQLLQINRVMGTAGIVASGLDMRLTTVEDTVEQHANRLQHLENLVGGRDGQ